MNPEQLKELVGEVVEERVHDAVKSISNEFKKAQAETAADPKLKTAEALKASGAFMKRLVEGETKDLSTSVDADGGFIVPTEFYGQLIEKRRKTAYIRRYATVLPMSSDKMDLQADGNDVSVNWTTELASITQSDPTFAQVTLSVNLLAGISRMSRQLLADAAINEGVAELVIRKFGNKIGRTEDSAFMTGSGVGQPKGLRQETVVAVAQAGTNLAANDITNLMHAVQDQYRGEGVFIMHDSVLKLVRNLRSTDGKKLFEESWEGGEGFVARLNGRPVITQNDIPTNLGAGVNESEIWFGDLSYYYVGDREEISAEVSTQEGTSFEKHRAAVKVFERLDGKLTIAEAFAKLTAVK